MSTILNSMRVINLDLQINQLMILDQEKSQSLEQARTIYSQARSLVVTRTQRHNELSALRDTVLREQNKIQQVAHPVMQAFSHWGHLSSKRISLQQMQSQQGFAVENTLQITNAVNDERKAKERFDSALQNYHAIFPNPNISPGARLDAIHEHVQNIGREFQINQKELREASRKEDMANQIFRGRTVSFENWRPQYRNQLQDLQRQKSALINKQ